MFQCDVIYYILQGAAPYVQYIVTDDKNDEISNKKVRAGHATIFLASGQHKRDNAICRASGTRKIHNVLSYNKYKNYAITNIIVA